MESIWITILLPVSASLPSTTLSSPLNCLKPPSCLPVTLEPVKPMVELSGATTYVRDLAAAGASAALAVAAGALVLELTLASGTLSAGLPQPKHRRRAGMGKRDLVSFIAFT